EHVGGRPYGYISFNCDLTKHLNFGPGKTNVLAVRADTSRQPASRWYSGAGIYRHVRVVITDPGHLERGGTSVQTVEVVRNEATLRVWSTITNGSGSPRDFFVDVSVLDSRDRVVATNRDSPHTVATTVPAKHIMDFPLMNPQRWDPASPNLYRA